MAWGQSPLIAQPFAGEQVQGERAQIENIKQVTAVPDGDKYQQVEQKDGHHGAEIQPMKNGHLGVLLIEGDGRHQRDRQLNDIVALGHAAADNVAPFTGQIKGGDQVIVGKGAGVEGNAIARRLCHSRVPCRSNR